MFKIIRKKRLNPTVTLMDIQAPLIARKAEPGQFIILRVDEAGERIPLTIADYDREKGTVTIIFQIVGATTEKLNHLEEGDSLHDFVGPLGIASHTEGLKKVAVIGGGVGSAIAYPIAKKLHAQGETVEVIDLNRVHKSYAVSAAFKYDRMALCATTYDSAYAPAMEAFLSSLKLKGMQGRKVALVENGTWAPMAAKHMRAVLDTMKNMQTLDRQVTIRSAMNAKNREELAELAQALAL